MRESDALEGMAVPGFLHPATLGYPVHRRLDAGLGYPGSDEP